MQRPKRRENMRGMTAPNRCFAGPKLALALSFLAAVPLFGCSEPVQEEFIRPVRSMVVGDAAAFREDSFPGRAKAVQEVDLAFEVTGQLVERPAKVGDVVTRGQVLARLDPRDYQNSLDAARSERDRAQTFYARVEKAARTGAVSQQDLTDAKARFDEVQSRVNIRRKALDDTFIVAPFDGTVSQTYVDNFQNVRAKQPVIRLLDVSQIEMVVNIPEGFIGLAPYVTGIVARFDAHPDQAVPAQIKEVSNEASRTTRTYELTLVMDPPEAFELLPGMAGTVTGRVEFSQDAADQGLEVPMTAVFSSHATSDQQSFVWLIAPEELTVSRLPVEVVARSPRGVTVRGISPGDRIATAGVHYLREGQKVRLP